MVWWVIDLPSVKINFTTIFRFGKRCIAVGKDLNIYSKIGHGFLLATAFCCGSIIMIIEVLGSRVIGPFFGVSLFVWTSLIAVAMISLAIGYAVGGYFADRYSDIRYLYIIIFLAGISIIPIPFIKTFVLKFSVAFGLRAGAFISSLLLFGPTLFLLGCVSPYLIKIVAKT